MSDIVEVKRALAGRVRSVAEYLLPAGKQHSHEWCVGSVDGEHGKSLKVHLSGEKAGLWSDFAAGGGGGDLIDLWSATKHIPLAQAIDEARTWLGMSKPEIHRAAPQRQWKRPPKPQGKKPEAAVLEYLREHRNIPHESISAYRVGEDGDRIVFPFLLPDGTLALVKTRTTRDGDKPAPTAKDCEPVLFGWQAVPPNERTVAICEGEIDALSLHAYGVPAMSVPYGGGDKGKQRWIESEFDRMARFERIYLALDMDDEGEKAAREIANRLGLHRCFRVTLPRKDANDCLVDGVTPAEIHAAFAAAKLYDIDELRLPSAYIDDVVELFYPTEGKPPGYAMPYARLADKLRFRAAEVTIWTGESGSGKTQILTDCAVDWVQQGSRICVSSLEMVPKQTLKRIARQVVGVEQPVRERIGEALRWLDGSPTRTGGLVLYTLTGKQKIDKLLETFNYARSRYGCDQFVIDSLMRLGISSEAYDEQEAVIFNIVDWAIANEVHVHLVAHSRKGDKDRRAPGTEDIKGAMEIGANAFNVISIWRNRKLESRIAKLQEPSERAAAWKEEPGVVLNVAKQRNGDFEGKVGLWFDLKSYRYRSAHDADSWKRTYPFRPSDDDNLEEDL